MRSLLSRTASSRRGCGRRVHAVPLLLIVCFLIAPLPASAGESKTRGAFTARGIPYADYFASSTTSSYWNCAGGEEGVHKTTFDYEAPFTGTLTASMSGFTGDWELLLLDHEGDVVGYNLRSQWVDRKDEERVSIRLKRRQTIQIVACNWLSSQTEVEVVYELARGDGGEPSRKHSRHLEAGAAAGLRERVPVNVVFIGLDRDRIDPSGFLERLPRRYRPLVRMKLLNSGVRDYIGIDYTYDYDVVFAPESYEDRFFGKLLSLGEVLGQTYYQRQYNSQRSNTVNVGNNLLIDAPSVEKWLAANPPAGVETTENTIFFINWYGRPDFKFHIYSKTGDPDPDTGVDTGTWESQMTNAWGGTTPDDEQTGLGALARVWFYDFSAGPDYISQNYIVDDKDLDGDGREDYRIPPIWEYARDGYRKPSALTGDAARLARYVGINLLFTASPLYDPAITPPRLPRRINLDLNLYEGSPGVDASENLLTPKVVRREVAELLPLADITVDLQELSTEDPVFRSCYESWFWLWNAPNCYPGSPYGSSANVFVHQGSTLADTHDGPAGTDYEASGFNYVFDGLAGGGYADHNHWDATQSFVHMFSTPRLSDWVGMTATSVHEYGHHFALSHPHDGYDYEEGLNYGKYLDRFKFTFVGTASNTVMSYLWVNHDFSQFDRDNMNRWQAAAYLESANAILAKIGKRGKDEDTSAALRRADIAAGNAKRSFSDHAYAKAASAAETAYRIVLMTAEKLGLKIVGSDSGTRVRSSDEGPARTLSVHPAQLRAATMDPLRDRPLFEELKRRLGDDSRVDPLPARLR